MNIYYDRPTYATDQLFWAESRFALSESPWLQNFHPKGASSITPKRAWTQFRLRCWKNKGGPGTRIEPTWTTQYFMEPWPVDDHARGTHRALVAPLVFKIVQKAGLYPWRRSGDTFFWLGATAHFVRGYGCRCLKRPETFESGRAQHLGVIHFKNPEKKERGETTMNETKRDGTSFRRPRSRPDTIKAITARGGPDPGGASGLENR